MTVLSKENPRVPDDERATVEPLGHGCYQVNVCYGFKDERDIPKALERSKAAGLEIDPMEKTPWKRPILCLGRP